MWLQAPNIGCIHGFSTRHGGFSPAPFNSLNLGGSADKKQNIKRNRELALSLLGLQPAHLFSLKQVHGSNICEPATTIQEGDALVTVKSGAILSVLVADCYPLLFCDLKNNIIGAAHCGWRGTLAGLAGKTVRKMQSMGAEVSQIKVAIGQGISFKNFEVGEEVITAFSEAGFPTAWHNRHLDLTLCLQHDLKQAGIPVENIWCMNRCTFEQDFFSHRRDNGNTGRMMAVISLGPE